VAYADDIESLSLAHGLRTDAVEKISIALRDAGLSAFALESIRIRLNARAPACPDGSAPSWESVTLPDGTVEFRLVCK
jgi:hypothetical protein